MDQVKQKGLDGFWKVTNVPEAEISSLSVGEGPTDATQ